MKAIKLILLLLCNFIYACNSSVKMSSDDVVIREVKRMIDDSCFNMKYELADSCLDLKYVIIKKNHDVTGYGKICEVYSSESPSFSANGMPPVKIIPYENLYICLIDFYSNNLLSKKEMQSLLGRLERTDLFGAVSDTRFLIGVPNEGEEITIVRENTDWSTHRINSNPYIYPEFSDYYWNKLPNSFPKIILYHYDILVNPSFKPGDSLKSHIEGLIHCSIYFMDGTETFFKDNQTENSYSRLVTVNGKDTLTYDVNPYINDKHLFFKTNPNPYFFKRLPTTNTWEYLDSLIRDSTFYIRYRNGEREYFPVAYSTIGYCVDVLNKNTFLGLPVQTFYARNVNDWMKDYDVYEKWYEEVDNPQSH